MKILIVDALARAGTILCDDAVLRVLNELLVSPSFFIWDQVHNTY